MDKNKKAFSESCSLLRKFRKCVTEFDCSVASAGFGYSLGDDLSYLLNANPIVESEDIMSRIELVESRSGVKFPWSKLDA